MREWECIIAEYLYRLFPLSDRCSVLFSFFLICPIAGRAYEKKVCLAKVEVVGSIPSYLFLSFLRCFVQCVVGSVLSVWRKAIEEPDSVTVQSLTCTEWSCNGANCDYWHGLSFSRCRKSPGFLATDVQRC